MFLNNKYINIFQTIMISAFLMAPIAKFAKNKAGVLLAFPILFLLIHKSIKNQWNLCTKT